MVKPAIRLAYRLARVRMVVSIVSVLVTQVLPQRALVGVIPGLRGLATDCSRGFKSGARNRR